MARKAMTQSSDSQNPPALNIPPRKERKFTLTKLGFEACRYFDEQDSKGLLIDTLPGRDGVKS